jgi:hypothetical protein
MYVEVANHMLMAAGYWAPHCLVAYYVFISFCLPLIIQPDETMNDVTFGQAHQFSCFIFS